MSNLSVCDLSRPTTTATYPEIAQPTWGSLCLYDPYGMQQQEHGHVHRDVMADHFASDRTLLKLANDTRYLLAADLRCVTYYIFLSNCNLA
jgi:hypothetical protein